MARAVSTAQEVWYVDQRMRTHGIGAELERCWHGNQSETAQSKSWGVLQGAEQVVCMGRGQ